MRFSLILTATEVVSPGLNRVSERAGHVGAWLAGRSADTAHAGERVLTRSGSQPNIVPDVGGCRRTASRRRLAQPPGRPSAREARGPGELLPRSPAGAASPPTRYPT